ncbi:MAG: hypothetical protein C0392_15495 [Syntrophus sp. (in: bacteria)]|nr:hypothetical protein [Syntrophus sp. (in: bacteria)]
MKKLQHYFNALHVYCVLCKLGVPKNAARKIAIVYEFITGPILYPERSRGSILHYLNRLCAFRPGVCLAAGRKREDAVYNTQQYYLKVRIH